ncbi:MAG: hypothetical protein AB8G26_00160 [Ilumatobacter sp.]
MREFVEDTGVDQLQHVDDPSTELWDRFGVTQQRTYAYIDDDGSFRLAAYGSLIEDVQALIDS